MGMKMRFSTMWVLFLLILWVSMYQIVAQPPPPLARPPPPPSPSSSPSPPPIPLPPSPSPSPSPPPKPLPPPKPRVVRCRDPRFPFCFNFRQLCPLACLTNCLVDCVTCRVVCSCTFPGAICQDPRFVGGDGITFYFHGRRDQDFCLVSDTNLHINGHFIGKRNPNLKRDFTWVQSIGIIVNNHKLLVAAKPTSKWDDHNDRLSISLNNTPISLPTSDGAMWKSHVEPLVTITRTGDTNHVMIEVSNNFRVSANVVPITAQESRAHGYNITDDDCFAHLELGFKFYSLSDKVDGVLGQTYRSDYVSKAKVNVPMPVMGGLHMYSSSGIFATDCQVSRFGRHGVVKDGGAHYSSMQCSSGMKGNGVVCKR